MEDIGYDVASSTEHCGARSSHFHLSTSTRTAQGANCSIIGESVHLHPSAPFSCVAAARRPVRAPIAEGEREYTRSGHQSRKGRENIPIAGTNRGTGERICLLHNTVESAVRLLSLTDVGLTDVGCWGCCVWQPHAGDIHAVLAPAAGCGAETPPGAWRKQHRQ
eukprot:738594-Pyramimonas_sp.AAC.1